MEKLLKFFISNVADPAHVGTDQPFHYDSALEPDPRVPYEVQSCIFTVISYRSINSVDAGVVRYFF
jgi:hypothetical protein